MTPNSSSHSTVWVEECLFQVDEGQRLSLLRCFYSKRKLYRTILLCFLSAHPTVVPYQFVNYYFKKLYLFIDFHFDLTQVFRVRLWIIYIRTCVYIVLRCEIHSMYQISHSVSTFQDSITHSPVLDSEPNSIATLTNLLVSSAAHLHSYHGQ